jgi:hypothetical protein
MSKASVVLDESEQNELEQIVIDKDEPAALRFVQEVVWERVRTARRQRLRSHLEAGQR